MSNLNRLLHRCAAVAVAAIVVFTLATPTARADASVPPTLTDGYGLTQVGSATGTATNFVITVTTAQVASQHHIKIILPGDYWDNPTRRYPVLYFLHGSPDDPIYQDYPALSTNSMITVIPDGGARGCTGLYTPAVSKHVKDHLDALGMPYYYVDYGNGSTWGCDGGHDSGCWAQDLEDYIPRLEQAFASA